MKSKSALSFYGLIVILTTSIALFMSSIYSYFIVPTTYESKTEMMVQQKNKNNEIKTVMTTTKDLLKSQNMLLVIQSQLRNEGVDYTVEELNKAIHINTQSHSQTIYMTVNAKSPLIAKQISTVASQLYQNEFSHLMKNNQLIIISKPSFDAQPINKHYPTLMIGSVIGLVIGLIIVLILGFNRSKITQRQRLNRLAVPVIASIPQMTTKEKSVRIHRVNHDEVEDTQNKKLDEENEMVDQLLRQETQQLDTLIRRRRKR